MDTTCLDTWLLAQIAVDEVAAEADLTIYGAPPVGSAHQEIWQPMRVLAECHAKREALILAADARSARNSASEGPIDAFVRIMAVPYADRPGYQLDWRPELHQNVEVWNATTLQRAELTAPHPLRGRVLHSESATLWRSRLLDPGAGAGAQLKGTPCVQWRGRTRLSSTPSTTPDPTVPDPYQPAPDPDSLPLDPDYAKPDVMPSHGEPGTGPVAEPGQVPDREPLPGE